MIIRKKDMKTRIRPQMKGGLGEVTVLDLVECENLPNIRFVGEMTLPQNASIGSHIHDKETEYYIITDGTGYVDEGDGREIKVTRGEVIVTGGGATHSIRNGGQADLKIIAFIVTH